MSTNAVAVAVKINPDLKERMKRLADARQRSTHWLMREAISQYVEREEKREAFRQDAMQSWHEYQETGLHVTGDEVVTWLDTWGADDETAPPACHP